MSFSWDGVLMEPNTLSFSRTDQTPRPEIADSKHAETPAERRGDAISLTAPT